MTKQFSPSTERNKQPIKLIFNRYLTKPGRMLEIGSGTGEHAVFFASHFPRINWVTSDLKENHPSIKAWAKDEKLPNLHGPETLQIGVDDFPRSKYDYVFSANTLHIMSWKEAKSLFKLLGKRLREEALVLFYGPFNYNGEYTSESNSTFDLWLKERSEKSGIRNFEDVSAQMTKYGFELVADHEMPANNRMLVFKRLAFEASGRK